MVSLFVILVMALSFANHHAVRLKARIVKHATAAAVIAATCLTCCLPTYASDTTTFRETIAKTVAVLPGMGQPDVYYPSDFAGSWEVDQTYTEIAEKQPTTRFLSTLQKLPIPATVKFATSFLERDGNVVLDRSFTETNRYQSLFKNSDASTVIAAQAQWNPTNPNVLTVSTSDNLIIEEKVTKRAVEQNLEPGTFGYSEYYRLAEADATGLQYSVPKIFGVRKLERFRVEGGGEGKVQRIRGMERMYVYSGDSVDIKAEPLAVVKSSFVMTRQQ